MIHQCKDWPDLSWKHEVLAVKLAELRYKLGLLLGKLKGMDLPFQQRSNTDITDWLDWFLGCLGRSIDQAEEILWTVLYQTRLWDFIHQQVINERQRMILGRMLDNFQGFMNTSKYAKMAKCSTDTALRDIQQLVSKGILIQNPGGGRSTSYRLPEEQELG